MKKYICPTLECIELKVEERLASSCTGSCSSDETVTLPDGTTYYLVTQGYSN